jgi:hypothetical protein
MEGLPMGMRKMLVAVLVVAVGLLISVPLAAHHGGASILSGKSVTMKGTVKAWLWANPHCLLTFEVKGEDGKVVQWVSETPAPNTIYPFGYRKDSFKPGDEITVTLNPVKSGAPAGSIVRVVLANGTTLQRVREPAQGRGAGAQY